MLVLADDDITNKKYVDDAIAAGGSSFYTTDGSLSSNRTVDGDQNTLTFNDLDGLTFSVQEAGVQGTASQTLTNTATNAQVQQVAISQDSSRIAVGTLTFDSGDGVQLRSTSGQYLLGGVVGEMPPVDNTLTDILVLDTTDFEIHRRSLASINTNIYTSDGNLAGNRIVDGDQNDLSFIDLNLYTFRVEEAGVQGSAIMAASNTTTSGNINWAVTSQNGSGSGTFDPTSDNTETVITPNSTFGNEIEILELSYRLGTAGAQSPPINAGNTEMLMIDSSTGVIERRLTSSLNIP